MTSPVRRLTAASRATWIVRLAITAGLAALLLWGGLQEEDPLAGYIHTDKMRHVISFGAVGVFVGLFSPRITSRLIMLGLSLAFAVVFEISQPIFSERTMSLTDLIASCIGIFSGYGCATAMLSLLELMRGVRTEPRKASAPSPP